MVLTIAVLAGAFSQQTPHPLPWSPAGTNDVRSPCPMLNTLANHGILPHDGKDITEQQTIDALYKALSIDEQLARSLHQQALTTNPQPNATTFSLNHLSRHNILEHDASLSRQDFYFGNNHDFDQAVFDETRSYWIFPIIDIKAAATARQARINTSKANNPTHTLSSLAQAVSLAESSAYIIVFGNKWAGTVRRSLIEYFFENERLPIELGWMKSKDNITTNDVITMAQRIANATVAIGEGLLKQDGLHGGRNG
ncbi:peroxidase family protein [Aspergillus homomorphus CBS 101889]|uniref:Cloroperoxidase n=1 Tax=Aspergillus homomorphus (strain CBS 101889) TaxID=1450537 RepID=A0A395HYR6_ASPHC|nr:Cloroperoxidase [Aspergillus homomorphus CBS 101889]RAL12605.1 Cloroperoxidase [Aspergillus homomorphus CBS 101889]